MAALWRRTLPKRVGFHGSSWGKRHHHTVRQYLQELEQQNPAEEPVHTQNQVSTTDPDSTYATKGGTPARLGCYDNYLVDNHSCVIVGVGQLFDEGTLGSVGLALEKIFGVTEHRPAGF